MWEGTPTQRLWGILESKLSYQVLESRFKCNQGARNVHVHFQLAIWYTHVTNDHLNGTSIKIRQGILATHD